MRPFRHMAWAAFETLLVVESRAARQWRLRAAIIFWRVQIARRRGRWYEVDLGERGRLVCPPVSSIGPMVAATGSHEPVEEAFVDALLRPGDVLLDIGANIGTYTIPAAIGGCRVICFEPSSETRRVLEANIERNRLSSDVHVRPEALSNYAGGADFSTGLDAMNQLVCDDTSHPVEPVDVATLDALTEMHPEWLRAAEMILMKVDAEGEDLAVLEGAKELLRRHLPIIQIETRCGSADVRDVVDPYGYRAYWYDEVKRKLGEIVHSWSGNFQFQTNVILVPDVRLSETAHRIAGARTTIHGRPRVTWSVR